MACAELKRVIEGGYFDMLMSKEKLDLRERMKEHRRQCASCEEVFQRAYNAHKFQEQAPLLRSILPPRLSPDEVEKKRAESKAILDDIRKMLGS
jgi:hypothetical protein